MYSALDRHPFIEANPTMQLAQDLLRSVTRLALLNKEIATEHAKNPYGLIIGDDVSARVPTIITHHFLRSARADGRIDTAPQTHFMASGALPNGQENLEETWQSNLTEYAADLLGKTATPNVLILTESTPVESSRSLARIEQAFAAHGAHTTRKVTQTTYLGDNGIAPEERDFVGFKKHLPEVVSRPQAELHTDKIAAFRGFLRDYADVVYLQAFGPIKPKQRRRKEQPTNPYIEQMRRFGI